MSRQPDLVTYLPRGAPLHHIVTATLVNPTTVSRAFYNDTQGHEIDLGEWYILEENFFVSAQRRAACRERAKANHVANIPND
jgi:hypothetical protein